MNIISKMSHELRNPLTAASSTVQLLEKKYPELSEDKFFKSLENDIQYMAELLTDFSQYSIQTKLHVKTFSLDTLMKEIVLSFAAMIADKNLSFSSKIELDNHPFSGDPIQLQQLFRNLLKNAVEATEAGDSIFLHAYAENDTVIVSIKDTGCGLTEEQITTIFEPFVTYNKKHGGGLGLPICKQIVEALHGKMELSSVLGEGTTFRVILPANDKCHEETGD